MQSYVFPVTDATANKWIKDAEDLLKTAEFHYKSRKYDLPYAFEMDLVLL
jgi:HEPN domain-containing protein